MKTPSLITRIMGTPWVAAALYAFCGLVVLGWASGEVSWWVGVAALCFAWNVGKAVHDLRRYKRWWADWEAMGSVPGVAAPAPIVRRCKVSSHWGKVMVAAASLVIIPMFVAAPGAGEALRNGLTLLWLGVATYLLWKLAASIRRALFHTGATRATARGKASEPADIVKWVLPPASSSPSRADTMRGVPDYCARLMVSH